MTSRRQKKTIDAQRLSTSKLHDKAATCARALLLDGVHFLLRAHFHACLLRGCQQTVDDRLRRIAHWKDPAIFFHFETNSALFKPRHRIARLKAAKRT